MLYFACYGNGRYIPKLASSVDELFPDSVDFKVVENPFNNFEDCSSFCNAMNIYLKGNFPEEQEEEVYFK